MNCDLIFGAVIQLFIYCGKIAVREVLFTIEKLNFLLCDFLFSFAVLKNSNEKY